MAYQLYYWSPIQGRGEFVRLALEDAAVDYRDVAREEGDGAVMNMMKDGDTPPFAPPFLVDGEVTVGQTAAILFYLGERLDLAPKDSRLKLWTHQIQLTIADVVVEAHDTHHPIGAGSYYEDQKEPALRRAQEFRSERIAKFLRWFETILERNPAGSDWLVDQTCTYVDLSLFQIVEGLSYAFPKVMKKAAAEHPLVMSVHDRVAQRPNIVRYLKSERRIPFNEDGIFRHYPELDG